ncbi:hypothetical protein HDU80_001251 [Chytriomyces hyalinus]|nr:hypothetical protein HDU80_001251 [Chytriomyces hyalinus]
MNSADGSYASHPTLKFALYNIKQSEQTMSSTSFGISQMIAEELLNLGQIRTMLMEEREGHSLVNNVEPLPNLPREHGCALTEQINHVLTCYTTIVNQVFVLRTNSWFKIVLTEGIGIDNYWHKYEFAKSRGTFHFHAILWKQDAAASLHSLLNRALQVGNMEELRTTKQEIAAEMPDVIEANLTKVSALHPSGRMLSDPTQVITTPWYTTCINVAQREANSEVCDHVRVGIDVEPDKVRNVCQWPAHEGVGSNPSNKSLKTKIFDIQDHVNDCIDFANRVLLHTCSSYCLVKKSLGKEPNIIVWNECRGYYGKENPVLKSRTDGKQAQSSPDLVQRKGILYLEMERDHPQLGANYDFQPVIAVGCDTATIEEGINVLQWIQGQVDSVNALPEDQQGTHLAQRLNLKILKSREVSSAECNFQLQGMEYYCATKIFTKIRFNFGDHELEANDLEHDGDHDAITLNLNQFDKNLYPTVVPVYMHASLKAVWPFTEGYARYVCAFNEFLTQANVPDYIVRNIQRAFLVSIISSSKTRQPNPQFHLTEDELDETPPVEIPGESNDENVLFEGIDPHVDVDFKLDDFSIAALGFSPSDIN